MSHHKTESNGARLRNLMDAGCVAAPGAFNGLVARAVKQAGFDACYVSGGATSTAMGMPDVGLQTLEEFCRAIRDVSLASGLPVLADADTGFGEAETARRTVIEYHRAGASGLHLEDQVFPKRCGHLGGKTLVPIDHMVEKVQWASKAARDTGDGTFIVCARTDAFSVDGIAASIERAKAYVHAGADMIFPEGLGTAEDFKAFAQAMESMGEAKPYLLANMTEFGTTDMIPLNTFAEMGYSIVIYPVTTLRIAMKAVTDALAQLKESGTAEGLLSSMQTRDELYELLGYTPGTPWEVPTANR
ncbi:MAG: isocitrate lyase/phosphoenolpyruvate mutase family protein [Planctomycetota bacterium]